jgi:hypothetical protein
LTGFFFFFFFFFGLSTFNVSIGMVVDVYHKLYLESIVIS